MLDILITLAAIILALFILWFGFWVVVMIANLIFCAKIFKKEIKEIKKDDF